ncbi:gliding motility-associated C-terminal domain-containing protein, partial [Flavobacterium sp. RSSA_27]|uniref:T9SS type B sorting domain-containing protein n=1 Tax=Flavobacterium sp. RSSA_27 TaxID=3447667 RepID=UPI003F3B15F2
SVLCAASTLQLSNATAAGVWTSNNTGIATVDGNGLVTGVNAGTVIISYTVTNANGCSNSVTKSISVTAKPSQPIITAAGPTAFCTPGSVVLSSSALSGNQWYKDGVAIDGATASTYTATTTGVYSVINTLNNCASNSSTTISVVANPKPNVNPIIGNATINVGTTTQLSNTTAGGVWNSSNPTLATVTSTGLVTGINNGDVIITYTVTNASGCSNSQSLLVKVNPFQLVAIDDDFSNTPINSAKGATLNVLSNDLLNDAPISIAQIVITVTNTDGLNDIVVDNQGNVIIPVGSPVGNYTLSYAICDSKNSNNCTTAQIKIVIKDPCDFDDSPSSCDIVVNNAISPNNDGYNDLFIIEKIENYPNNSVEIFDRYGKPVFRIEGYNNTSNVFKGISNGPITVNKDDYLANGTYYYVIKYNKPLSGNTNQKTGYLFLSR